MIEGATVDVQAAVQHFTNTIDLTHHWAGYTALVVFALGYIVVMFEERLHLRKSQPVILAAGLIWMLIGLAYVRVGDASVVAAAVRTNVAEFGELFLFIVVAVTYVNTMEERGVFDALRAWLTARRLSYRALFWLTGVLAFFLSSQIDNLTTALVIGTVVLTLGRGNSKFIALGCINVVVAANAGGAWSPFGDITTLMVWQSGHVTFWQFYKLFVPSLVNWIIPAVIMQFAVPKGLPEAVIEHVPLKRGAFGVVGLFAVTIVITVSVYNLLELPPFIGMTTGLGLLKLYSFVLSRTRPRSRDHAARYETFDVYETLQRAEWDTLLFFYGIILCVGGLALLGYLGAASNYLYVGFGATAANVAIGIISAVVDNIPVMFAVLNMRPSLDLTQWLLVTMTAGVGGSLLSIGSAAGVALMGHARGKYTFGSHLRWTWAIALGYAASIWVHLLIN